MLTNGYESMMVGATVWGYSPCVGFPLVHLLLLAFQTYSLESAWQGNTDIYPVLLPHRITRININRSCGHHAGIAYDSKQIAQGASTQWWTL
jgi:hypothetical protein